MIPKYNSNNPGLINSIVCFSDILGFSNLVKSTGSDTKKGDFMLNDLHSVLTKQYAEMNKFNIYGNFKAFTDNVIMAYPIIEDGEGQFGSIITSFLEFQLNMVLKGYFLRGGISLGDYYGSGDFAYGPALIEAHELESKIAINPRIILSDSTIEMVRGHLKYYYPISNAPQNSHLLIDTRDGVWFLNYLQIAKEYYYEYNSEYKKLAEILFNHKVVIEKKINEFSKDFKIRSKYEWVAEYHNYYCYNNLDSKTINDFDLTIKGIKHSFFCKII